jgi:formate hydrogenlyase subunit 3/multisubunit Na+/H+ antiporter MnhD subunit
MLVGLMSIAGLPLTAGFPGRWGLLLALAPIDPFAGWAIVIAFFSIGVTTLRWADILLSEPHIRAQGSRSIRERLTLGGGVALSLLVGAFPQIIYPWVVEGVSGVAQLLP